MKKIIPIIVLTLAGTLMVVYNSPGQDKKWTLEECVLYAIEHNIQVKQQELAADVQQNALNTLKSDCRGCIAFSNYFFCKNFFLEEKKCVCASQNHTT